MQTSPYIAKQLADQRAQDLRRDASRRRLRPAVRRQLHAQPSRPEPFDLIPAGAQKR